MQVVSKGQASHPPATRQAGKALDKATQSSYKCRLVWRLMAGYNSHRAGSPATEYSE
jgi:hypothetical protein